MALEKVTFNPRDSVIFEPDSTKQEVKLQIINLGTETITYKMKSTRPGLYKMRPVFGKVAPGDTTIVRLIFKGIKNQQPPPMKDRFSIIYTLAPSTTADMMKVWKQHKFHTKLAENGIKRHQLRVLYKGVNDQEPEKLEEDESEIKPGQIKKRMGLIDQEDTKVTSSEPARPILLMYREQPPITDSGSDSDEDKEKETLKPTSKISTKPILKDFRLMVKPPNPIDLPTAMLTNINSAAPINSQSKEVKTTPAELQSKGNMSVALDQSQYGQGGGPRFDVVQNEAKLNPTVAVQMKAPNSLPTQKQLEPHSRPVSQFLYRKY